MKLIALARLSDTVLEDSPANVFSKSDGRHLQLKVGSVVRQIALQFAYRKKHGSIIPDDDEIALAMAFIIAESKKKGTAKIKQLAMTSIPYWIVQVSGDRSILLSATGESATGIEMSESKSISQVRRIISNETTEIKDIPEAVGKAYPLFAEVETKTQQLRNLLNPNVFKSLGEHIVDLEPGSKIVAMDMTVDTQGALAVSQEYQTLVDEASTRLGTMETLHRLTKERLSDRLTALENLIETEMSRWEKRHAQMTETNKLKTEALREGLSDTVYKLKDRRKKDEGALVAEFARETVELERFFTNIVEDIRAVRERISSKDTAVPEAAEKCKALLESLSKTVSSYSNVADSTKAMTENTLQKASDLDNELSNRIQEEETSTDSQIDELHKRVAELGNEMESKKSELDALRASVSESVTKMDEAVTRRIDELREEIWNLKGLSMSNDSIPGLSPLTQINVMVYVVAYNRGNPKIVSPILVPDTKVNLPYEYESLNAEFDKFIQKSTKQMMKDSHSFEAAIEKATVAANVFQNPESGRILTKGLERLRDRQVLGEDMLNSLKSEFTKLVGKCPQCGADFGAAGKFCPEGVAKLSSISV
ncbi:MAG: hypothetical protein AM324_013735 [Candidatus Thorarchaeota archaeon SMTZ1-83]|nr:MAG: hypothetical protein AM324_14870 [Candidatus Thorarchaeota archaeon SMTZ1-83]